MVGTGGDGHYVTSWGWADRPVDGGVEKAGYRLWHYSYHGDGKLVVGLPASCGPTEALLVAMAAFNDEGVSLDTVLHNQALNAEMDPPDLTEFWEMMRDAE